MAPATDKKVKTTKKLGLHGFTGAIRKLPSPNKHENYKVRGRPKNLKRSGSPRPRSERLIVRRLGPGRKLGSADDAIFDNASRTIGLGGDFKV
jgi:hypothetical protein